MIEMAFEQLGRVFRFGVVGIVTTGVAYAIFIPLLSIMHYVPAMVLSWTVSVATGYLLNHSFTFRMPQKTTGQVFLYVAGALLQLGLAIIGYGLLTERIGLSPSPAFFCNLVVTATFSFAFMSLITFRRQSGV